jgi:hypothetical protein
MKRFAIFAVKGRGVGTGIKGSQFHQDERTQVFEILIGGDVV